MCYVYDKVTELDGFSGITHGHFTIRIGYLNVRGSYKIAASNHSCQSRF
jgi:hypothetical protein